MLEKLKRILAEDYGIRSEEELIKAIEGSDGVDISIFTRTENKEQKSA